MTVTGPAYLDIQVLYSQLRLALRHGARTSRLLQHAPALVELLCSAADYPDLSDLDRALKVENLIRAAIESIGGDHGKAIAIVLGLLPGTMGILTDRRQAAARLLDVRAETFRRPWNEGALLFDLAVEVYRLYTSGVDTSKS